MMGWGWHHGYGMGVGMWLTGVLLVLVIAAVVFLVVRLAGDAGRGQGSAPLTGGPTGPNPRELLALRYARGEISTAEYEERLGHLAP